MVVINDIKLIMKGGSFFMKKNKIKELTKELLKDGTVKDVIELQSILKDMLKQGVEAIMDGELENELGYEKYDNQTDKTNYRNGYSKKTVKSDLGEVDLIVPRDRNGEYDPEIVPKHSRDISGLEDKVISMYAKGMSTRDISNHIEDLYGYSVSAEMISRITDKVLPKVEAWQNRPLNETYMFVFMDAIHYKVKHNNKIINKAAYIVIGIDDDGFKDVLGIWIGENETSKFWLKVLNDLKNRGVNHIHICSIDGLPGFKEAISLVYPKAQVQRCIVHQIRYTLKYVNYKDRKIFAKDLKEIYTAPNEESGHQRLQEVIETWGSKYPTGLSSWTNNWDVISPFFKYSPEIRKIMYTTNAIESLNRQYRKVTKGKAIFSTDTSLLKALFLATEDATKKWSSRYRNWDLIKNELLIMSND